MMRMSTRWFGLGVVWVVALLAGCAAPPTPPAEDAAAVRAAIEAVNGQFQDAFAAGDAAAVAALYTADGQVLPPNAPAVTGTDALRGYWQGAMDAGIRSVALSTREMEIFGDTAIELGGYTVAVEGGQVVDEGSFLVVWKRRDGAWRLHRDIFNSDRTAGEE
jgi:uncharacterized protein (TIGR02246 family)